MRVIEPRHLDKVKKARKRRPKIRTVNLIIVGAVAAAGAYLVFAQDVIIKQAPDGSGQQSGQANSDDAVTDFSKPSVLKTFTATQFKELYSSYAYPNTQQLTEPPSITGDEAADKRIRDIAEKRGYKLSAVPVANIVKLNEPGLSENDLIQPNALIAWQELKKAAKKAGIPLQMTSAYRSIELQRTLFMREMDNEGVYTESVALGFDDDGVTRVLKRVAIPGYSRHHTGYTIDLACDGIGLDSFLTTSCYAWLSDNNYENAKKYGWVPSYPSGVSLQGPEPEPWEYIWVGKDILFE